VPTWPVIVLPGLVVIWTVSPMLKSAMSLLASCGPGDRVGPSDHGAVRHPSDSPAVGGEE
jgi:hypothetical protein